MSLRLDKREEYVLCGVVSCGARIGERAHNVLALLPGYARGDGDVLRMTARSIRRYRSGQYPRPLDRPAATPGGRHGIRPGPYPLKVQCWRCEWIHDADPKALKVDEVLHDAWMAWNW